MEIVKRVIAWALERRIVRAALRYTDNRGAMLADSVTYRALFSVFAGVLLGLWLASLWLTGNPEAWQAIVAAVQTAVPGLLGPDGVITDVDSVPEMPGLTVAGIASLIGLIAAALGAIGALRTAVRTIAGTAMADAMLLWVVLRNLLLAVGIAASFVVSAALTVLGRIGIGILAGFVGLDADSPLVASGVRIVSVLIVFVLDAALVAGIFVLLSGRSAPASALWSGALIGAIGLIVLQELSGLFVGGASSNPLLASFGALLALLIWLNFSTQVILVACAHIVTGIEEHEDRVHARFGARTLAQHAVQRAEREVASAVAALNAARAAESRERKDAAPTAQV